MRFLILVVIASFCRCSKRRIQYTRGCGPGGERKRAEWQENFRKLRVLSSAMATRVRAEQERESRRGRLHSQPFPGTFASQAGRCRRTRVK